tara:strand:+ start:598 stop:1311 length:714 start_codon:yes stop_codon:yes gene_type:complete
MNNEHLYGRFGDTDLIKTSSGEKWHVNKLEKSIIDRMGAEGEDFVAYHGSGTTNPITGHKEQWIPAAIAAVGLGMKLFGMYKAGKAAEDVDSSGAVDAAEGVAQAETETAWESYMADRSQQFTSSIGKVVGAAKQTASSVMDIFNKKESVNESTGLVSSGEVDDQYDNASSQVRDDYKSTTNQFQSEYDYTGNKMNIAQSKELASIEERFQSRLAEIERVPDTFREGFWGTNNYKVG